MNSISVGEWPITGLQCKKSSLYGGKIVLPALEITHIAVYLGLAVNWSQFSIFPPVYDFIKFVP